MQIDVIPSVGEARSDDFTHKTVIVIDVLRATTTLIAALANGCTGVIPVETVNQAKLLQEPEDLMGGERYCKKIPGFHFGNSPFEYTTDKMQGKRLILTTTNGTRGIQKAQKAEFVLAGALINNAACAQAAVKLKHDLVILCAGTQDVFSYEDGLCAGALIEEIIHLQGNQALGVNDFGLAMLACFKEEKQDLLSALVRCSNGKRLSRLGFQADIAYCSQLNQLKLVPILQQGIMVPHVFHSN